jgi:hypothetical protein
MLKRRLIGGNDDLRIGWCRFRVLLVLMFNHIWDHDPPAGQLTQIRCEGLAVTNWRSLFHG